MSKISEAKRIFETVTGRKAEGLTATAVGLVWAIESKGTLLDRVLVAEEALKLAKAEGVNEARKTD